MTHVYYLTVSGGQESRCRLARSPAWGLKAEMKVSAEAELSETRGHSKHTQLSVQSCSQSCGLCFTVAVCQGPLSATKDPFRSDLWTPLS